MEQLAPIVIFTYRRQDVKNLISSLLLNEIAKECNLFIFSDGYKNDIDKKDVLEVRAYLKTIKGFKDITIIEAIKNKGLANSVIDGTNSIINKYGKIIVLEDDLVVSKNFLNYMNASLSFYDKNSKIWSITGYGPDLPNINEYAEDVYLSVRGSSWSWATWKDRWYKIDWEIKDFDKIKKNKKIQEKFNLGGNDLYKMLELQMLGKIDSWAIRWVYNQYKLNMYTVYPKYSQISNNGFNDDKGTHNNTQNDKWSVDIVDVPINICNIQLDNNITQKFKTFYDLSLKTKIGYFFKKYGMYKIAKFIYKVLLKIKK